MRVIELSARVAPGVLAAVLVVLPARAAELVGGDLTVSRSEAASDCPDDAELARATLARGSAPSGSAEPLHVEVGFERAADGYVALIRTSGRKEGLRELRKPGESCAPLAEAVSLVLAVLFDLLPPEPESPPLPAPTIAPTKVPALTAPPPTTAPPPLGPELSLSLAVQGIGAYGLLGSAFTGALGGGVRPRLGRWELGLGALWAPGRDVPYLDRVVSVGLSSARFEACGWLDPSLARPDAGACLGFLVGALRGDGRGFDTDLPASDVWLATALSAVGRVPLAGQWALRGGAALVIPLQKQTFSVANAGVAFRTSPAALLVELGPELSFR